MMNCKQGDLAIVVKSVMGNEGKIVRCVKFANYGEKIISECKESVLFIIDDTSPEHVAWHIDDPLIWSDGYSYRAMKDSSLRPIRDQNGEDEMLLIAGLPNAVEA